MTRREYHDTMFMIRAMHYAAVRMDSGSVSGVRGLANPEWVGFVIQLARQEGMERETKTHGIVFLLEAIARKTRSPALLLGILQLAFPEVWERASGEKWRVNVRTKEPK